MNQLVPVTQPEEPTMKTITFSIKVPTFKMPKLECVATGIEAVSSKIDATRSHVATQIHRVAAAIEPTKE